MSPALHFLDYKLEARFHLVFGLWHCFGNLHEEELLNLKKMLEIRSRVEGAVFKHKGEHP